MSWDLRLTPALPAQWPPTSNSAPVVRYAYGAAFDPSIHGERNSAPFAMVEIAGDGATKVTQLTKALEQLEIQGVRPITKGEAELQSGDLIAPARAGQMSSLRVPWCTWKRNHGVVSKHLEQKHAAFFEALQCDSVKGGGGKSK